MTRKGGQRQNREGDRCTAAFISKDANDEKAHRGARGRLATSSSSVRRAVSSLQQHSRKPQRRVIEGCDTPAALEAPLDRFNIHTERPAGNIASAFKRRIKS